MTLSGTSAEMQHWAPDSPDGGSDENCAAMTVGGDDAANGFWTDISCTSDNVRAICEKDSSATPTTQGWRHGEIARVEKGDTVYR